MRRRSERMSCSHVLELLEGHVDGDLSSLEMAAVDAHLRSCRTCAAERRLAEQVRRELRALPGLDAPGHVLAAVDLARTPVRSRRWLRPALAAAAMLCLVVAGALLSGRQSPDPSVPAEMTPAEATRQARLALALVGDAGRRAGASLREELVQRRSVERVARSLRTPLLIIRTNPEGGTS